MFGLLAGLAVLTKAVFNTKSDPVYQHRATDFTEFGMSAPLFEACLNQTTNTTISPVPCFIAWSPNTSYVHDIATQFAASQQRFLHWSDVFFNDSKASETFRNADPTRVFLNVDFADAFNYTVRINSTYLPISFSSGILKQPPDSSAYTNAFAGLQHALNLEIIKLNNGTVDGALVDFQLQQLATRASSVGGIVAQILSMQYPALLVIAFMPVINLLFFFSRLIFR